MAAKSQVLSVQVPEHVKAELDRLAESRNQPRAELVSEALIRYIDDETEYLDAVDEASKEADDGVFVSGDKVIAWMKSWGTVSELPMPEPDVLPSKTR